MHYFKDKQNQIISIDDHFWPSVLKNEPWIKECDARGNELGSPLVIVKGAEPLEDKVIQEVKAPEIKPTVLPTPAVTVPKQVTPPPPPPEPELSTETIKKVTEPVKPPKVNELEKLKEEKLKSYTKLDKTIKVEPKKVTVKKKTNVKSTGIKRKAKAKKA